MSSSPMCIKCGDYIHHGPIVCEPCFFNVETRHKSEMDVQAHRLREVNAELLAALKNLRAITNSALPHISKEWCRMGAPDGNHMEMSIAMSNAAEAIAKAEGAE